MKTWIIFSSATLFLAPCFAATSFYLNKAGYETNRPKSAIVESDLDLSGTTFEIRQGDAAVFSGTIPAGYAPDFWSTNNYFRLDFSALNATGNFTIVLNSGEASPTFAIAKDNFQETTLGLVLNYFRLDRNTNSDVAVPVYGSGTTRDVHGGWDDASGDASKYLSHLSYANYLNPQQIPLTVWALAFSAEHIPTRGLAATSDANFAKDEAVYGADFLVRMQDDAGFFYMTVFDNWGASSRGLCAFSGSDGERSADYQAAFREGGGMAIAALARVASMRLSGDYSPEEYYAAALKGFKHLQEKQTLGGACAYCDDKTENIIDDYTALLAAAELYNATPQVTDGIGLEYLEVARARAKHLAERLSDDGYFWSDNQKTRPFWHASDAGLPLIALLRYLEIEADETYKAPIIAAAQKHLDWMIRVTDLEHNPFGYARQVYKTQGKIKEGFFIPHDNEANYWWQGEDARIASLAAAANYATHAFRYADSAATYTYATDQLDWILGKNPFDLSMMYGIGSKNVPQYSGSLGKGSLKGGIANGITGKNTDGSGIVWNNVNYAGYDIAQSWQNWRWVEHWLPHSTWYLLALATHYDENVKTTAISKAKAKLASFQIQQNGRTLQIQLSKNANAQVRLVDLQGKVLMQKTIDSSAQLDLTNFNAGIYFVQVPGFGNRKIAIR